ncbi:MAG: hypothetical protein NTX49_09050 [Chlamydiae bacterium]|nr:hypothetical protein [Chlamydiota bacterium]
MTSITRSNPILHSTQGGASASSHRPTRDTRITIRDCDPKVINVFKRFLDQLNKYSGSLPALTPPDAFIIEKASISYIDSIERLLAFPNTHNTTIIAISIFNQLLPGKEYFNQHSLNEIKTALETFLIGSETLKLPPPIQADGSRVSPQSTVRDSSPEIERSSGSSESLQSSIESIPEDSAIPEELEQDAYPELEQDAIPEEIEEDAYLDDFSPEEALPASETHLPARAHRT